MGTKFSSGSFVITLHERMTDNDLTDLSSVALEYLRAREKYGGFPSPFHGYAVILEELEEAWEQLKHGSVECACKEMVQVAAMALTFINEFQPRIGDTDE